MMQRVTFVLTSLALLAGASDVVCAQDADSLARAARYTYVAADYEYQTFFGDISPWQLGSISGGLHGNDGSLIARVNEARRFDANGTQGEVDAYPRLGDGRYAYLNLGYAGSSPVFPRWRWGAEYFTSLPDAYEASLGIRQLRFGGPPATLLTGAVGKYAGNYWFSARPWLRFKPTGVSASLGLTTRRYYADGDHWIGAQVGFGSTPSDRLTANELARTNSASASVGGSGGPWRTTIATWSIGYEREQLPTTRARTSLTFDLGLRHRL